MIDWIDETSERQGTEFSRENMMAIQGFQAKTTVFNDDGSITETDKNGNKMTAKFSADGNVVETFTGEKTITKTTIFNGDGSITEVIS